MSGIAIGLNHVLDKLSNHSDHIECYLAMGATRFEAGSTKKLFLNFNSNINFPFFFSGFL